MKTSRPPQAPFIIYFYPLIFTGKRTKITNSTDRSPKTVDYEFMSIYLNVWVYLYGFVQIIITCVGCPYVSSYSPLVSPSDPAPLSCLRNSCFDRLWVCLWTFMGFFCSYTVQARHVILEGLTQILVFSEYQGYRTFRTEVSAPYLSKWGITRRLDKYLDNIFPINLVNWRELSTFWLELRINHGPRALSDLDWRELSNILTGIVNIICYHDGVLLRNREHLTTWWHPRWINPD